MNDYLIQAHDWYETRTWREQLFVLALSFSFLYALAYFLFFKTIETNQVIIKSEIKTLKSVNVGWSTQINALKELNESPIYKKWQSQRAAMKILRGKFKYQIQSTIPIQWQDIVKTVLQKQHHVTLVQVKNYPETRYSPADLPSSAIPIFQQKLLVIVNGNFLDTLNYIQSLEAVLPTIHWESLNYEVLQYPNAIIQMEFAIFYEKT